MKQAFIYFGSAIVALLLAYGVNQLPNVPDAVKPAVPIVVVALVVISVWFAMQQAQGSSAPGTSVSGNKIKGKKNKMRGRTGAKVDQNDIDGDENEISIDDGTTGSGRNP
jgi:hypothetical protein